MEKLQEKSPYNSNNCFPIHFPLFIVYVLQGFFICTNTFKLNDINVV